MAGKHNITDYIGKQIGKWTVLGPVVDKKPNQSGQWVICRCECGAIREKNISVLLSGKNKCCLKCMPKYANFRIKHGMTNTRIYSEWASMKSRCYQKKCTAYKNYGAKGVTICDEWRKDFLSFYNWSMSNGYDDSLTIDRKDPKKGYGPDNCCWATVKEQTSHLSMPITNTSGYKGISWDKHDEQWVATISVDNKSYRIGAFLTQKEAAEAYNKYIDDHNIIREKIIYEGEKSNLKGRPRTRVAKLDTSQYIGQKFGSLIVLEEYKKARHGTNVICQCEKCGKKYIRPLSGLIKPSKRNHTNCRNCYVKNLNQTGYIGICWAGSYWKARIYGTKEIVFSPFDTQEEALKVRNDYIESNRSSVKPSNKIQEYKGELVIKTEKQKELVKKQEAAGIFYKDAKK